MLWKNVLVIIGALFTIVFCWTILFPIIGIPLWYFGHKRAKATLTALEHGRAVPGRLEEIYRDPSVKSNGRSPLRLVYSFTTEAGVVQEGWCHSWKTRPSQRTVGEALWVVYMPDDPETNATWPPLI